MTAKHLKQSLFEKIFGICPQCGSWFSCPKVHRMNCSFQNDSDNFVLACEKCFIGIEEYWDERWREYRNGLL